MDDLPIRNPLQEYLKKQDALVSKLVQPPKSKNPAKWMRERIVQSIADFEEELDHEHEVGARLVSFGAELTFHIVDVGYWGPDMITFAGIDANKNAVQLLQHYSQLSVLLMAVEKTQTEPRRIGIRLLKESSKEDDEAKSGSGG